MRIEFTTNPKAVEKANYILAQAIQSLRDNPILMKAMELENINLYEAAMFRKQMIRGFHRSAKKQKGETS